MSKVISDATVFLSIPLDKSEKTVYNIFCELAIAYLTQTDRYKSAGHNTEQGLANANL